MSLIYLFGLDLPLWAWFTSLSLSYLFELDLPLWVCFSSLSLGIAHFWRNFSDRSHLRLMIKKLLLWTLECFSWSKKGEIQLFVLIWLCTKFHYSLLQYFKSKTDLSKTQMDNFFSFTKLETLAPFLKIGNFLTIFKGFFRFKALYKSWSHPYHFLSLDCNFLANSGSRVDANGHHGQLFYFGWPFVLAFTRNFRGFTTWDHWRNRLVEAKRQKFFPMLVKSQTPDSNARTWKGQEKVTLTKFTTYTVWKIKVFSTT